MKDLYIDVCTLSRPFDGLATEKEEQEISACQDLLSQATNGKRHMLFSKAHLLEIEAIPENEERLALLELLFNLGEDPPYDAPIAQARAIDLVNKDMGIADAAHVAIAEQIADCFVTISPSLLEQRMRLLVRIPVLHPTELA